MAGTGLNATIIPTVPIYQNGSMTLPWIQFFNSLYKVAGGAIGNSIVLADGSTTPIYTITGSPLVNTGTLTFTLNNEGTNSVFAGPSSGGAAQPTFRMLVAGDVPIIPISKGGTGQVTANGGFNALSPLLSKGDLLTYSSTNDRLGAGANGQVLSVDSSTLTGLQWITPASGTVTAVTVATANGFSGTTSGGSTPVITLQTTITGIPKGNGTALSTATAGTDYSVGTSALATGILKSTTGTGTLSIAVAADFPTLNQNTSGSAGSLSPGNTINGVTFTGGSPITVTAAAGTLTGTTLNATVVGSSLTSVGTITAGVWNGTTIDPTHGGTGQTAYATGDTLYASATNTLSKRSIGTTGQVSTVIGGIPVWSSTPTLTGTNFTGIPNSGLTNSSITIGTTTIALGSSSLTLAGLSSVSTTNAYVNATAPVVSEQALVSTTTAGAVSNTVRLHNTSTTTGTGTQLILSAMTNATAVNNNAIIAGTAVDTAGNGMMLLQTSTAGTASTKVKIDQTGNLITNFGYADNSVNRQIPATGFTFTVPNGTQTVILDPTVTIATGTVTMPSAPTNGQIAALCVSKTISTLTVLANTGQTMSTAFSSGVVGGSAALRWIYVTADTTWYRA